MFRLNVAVKGKSLDILVDQEQSNNNLIFRKKGNQITVTSQ